jgi:hypothetical protein
MDMKHTTLMLGILLLVALSHVSHAGTLRCSETGAVVSNGDTTTDVLTKCGTPTHREKRRECRESRTSVQGSAQTTDCTMVDVWTYNFGPRRLVHKLIFKSGRLTAIQTHGYGQ